MVVVILVVAEVVLVVNVVMEIVGAESAVIDEEEEDSVGMVVSGVLVVVVGGIMCEGDDFVSCVDCTGVIGVLLARVVVSVGLPVDASDVMSSFDVETTLSVRISTLFNPPVDLSDDVSVIPLNGGVKSTEDVVSVRLGVTVEVINDASVVSSSTVEPWELASAVARAFVPVSVGVSVVFTPVWKVLDSTREEVAWADSARAPTEESVETRVSAELTHCSAS
jgi:hypothetical protein